MIVQDLQASAMAYLRSGDVSQAISLLEDASAHAPDNISILLDLGSAYVKIGFSGEPGPRFVFPCLTGTEKYKSEMVDVSA